MRALPSRRLLVVLLVLAVVAGLAYWQLRDDGDSSSGSGGSSSGSDALPPPRRTQSCAPPTAPVAPALRLPAPSAVSLRLLNGTAKDGLGAAVGGQLVQRGFRVGQTGNAPKAAPGASQVLFGPAGRPGATLLAAQVLGAQLVPQPAAAPGSVALVLGGTYTRLRTPAEATAWLATATRPAAAPTC